MLKIFFITILMAFGFTIQAQETTPEPTADTQDFESINLGISEINAYFQTDILETQLGMPIPIQLIVEMPAGYSILDETDTILTDPFQIIESEEAEIRIQGNRQILEQELTVALWELDTLTTDEIFLTYQTPAGEQFQTPVTSITISISPTRVESDIALRPLKPLIDLPFTPPYMFAIPVILVIIVILIIRNIQFNRRVQQALATPDSPIQKAVIELKHLLDTNATTEEIYPYIADAIRNYLTQQFHIRAIDMTTAELTNALEANPIFSDSLRSSLSDLLEQADLVKFANHRPITPPENIVDYAIRWIEQAERARIAHE